MYLQLGWIVIEQRLRKDWSRKFKSFFVPTVLQKEFVYSKECKYWELRVLGKGEKKNIFIITLGLFGGKTNKQTNILLLLHKGSILEQMVQGICRRSYTPPELLHSHGFVQYPISKTKLRTEKPFCIPTPIQLNNINTSRCKLITK